MFEINNVVLDTLLFAFVFVVCAFSLIKMGMRTFGTPRMISLLAAGALIIVALVNAVTFFLTNFYSD